MDIIGKKRLQWYGENTKINNGMDTDRKKKKRKPKKYVDRGSTSSHGNKELGTRSMEKQTGMEFGFQKMVTAVMKLDRQVDIYE